MKKSNVISGIFVDRNVDDLEEDVVDVSSGDIADYLAGRYNALTHRKIAYLKRLVADPYGKRWEAAHADWIFVDERDLLGFLFVYFPSGETMEESYQNLRKIVGPHPVDYSDLWELEGKFMEKAKR